MSVSSSARKGSSVFAGILSQYTAGTEASAGCRKRRSAGCMPESAGCRRSASRVAVHPAACRAGRLTTSPAAAAGNRGASRRRGACRSADSRRTARRRRRRRAPPSRARSRRARCTTAEARGIGERLVEVGDDALEVIPNVALDRQDFVLEPQLLRHARGLCAFVVFGTGKCRGVSGDVAMPGLRQHRATVVESTPPLRNSPTGRSEIVRSFTDSTSVAAKSSTLSARGCQ